MIRRLTARQVQRVLVVSVVLAWVVLVGWLLLSSPTVEQAGVPGRLVCPAVGRGNVDRSLMTTSSEEKAFIGDYLRERKGVDDIYELGSLIERNGPTEVHRLCADARTNRLASLVLAVGAGLALVVVGVTGNLVRRTAEPRDDQSPDPPAVRSDRPPPRPPGLGPRPRYRHEDDGPRP